MSIQIMSGYNAYLGKYDISPDFARVNMTTVTPTVENTPMSVTDNTRTYLAGLPEGDVDFEGYWQEGTDTISDILNTYQTTEDVLLMVYASPSGSWGGCGTKVGPLSIIRSEEIGDMARIRFTGKPDYPMVRIAPLYDLTSRGGPGTNQGNSYQLGAVAAGQTLYGFLCVTAVSGSSPTLVVNLQSAATEGGVYTTRIAFTSTAVATYEVKTASGPITDTWWRQQWVIGGTTPSFTFTSALGIK